MKYSALLLTVSFSLVVGCDTEDDAPGLLSATENIGPEGGWVSLDDGASIDIPSGALDEAVAITLSQTDDSPSSGYEALSRVYRFEPSGLTFDIAATATMPFTGAADEAVMYWSQPGGGYEDIGGEASRSLLAAQIMHFSTGFVGRRLGADGDGDGDADGDGDGDADGDSDGDGDADGDSDGDADGDADSEEESDGGGCPCGSDDECRPSAVGECLAGSCSCEMDTPCSPDPTPFNTHLYCVEGDTLTIRRTERGVVENELTQVYSRVGEEPICEPVFYHPIACGGDLVGTWTITSVCADIEAFRRAVGGTCPAASISEPMSTASGTLTVDAFGNITRDITGSTTATIGVPSACRVGPPGSECAITQTWLAAQISTAEVNCVELASNDCDCQVDMAETYDDASRYFDGSRSGEIVVINAADDSCAALGADSHCMWLGDGMASCAESCTESADCSCSPRLCVDGECVEGYCPCRAGLTSCHEGRECTDLDTDVANCGECRHHCRGDGAICVSGVCTASNCPGDPETEFCDELDNDCDGEVDEGFVTGEYCELVTGAMACDGRPCVDCHTVLTGCGGHTRCDFDGAVCCDYEC